MAEIIISPVATVIINALGSAAVKKIGALYSVTDDLEDLKETLEAIGAVLLDAERQQNHNNQVRLWLDRLADVVNDADDLVDGVASNGLLRALTSRPGQSKAREKVRVFFSSSNQLVFRTKLSIEIARVRKRLAAISADRRDFKLEEIASPVRRSWRESHSSVVEESVVGRVDDKKRVMELLMEKKDVGVEERVRVVSIFGMGGLGKTTLAKLIFNDGTVQERFDLKSWVCVSDNFDVKVILGLVVRSLVGTNATVDGSTMEELQNKLREIMSGKRYLLVLDDVWNENQQMWRELMAILSNCGDFGSRVVVTARSERVAKLTSNVLHACRLGKLSNDEAWSLFKKIAFEQRRETTKYDGEEIGMEIVKKCGGVPLAVKMTASMLSTKDPITEWPAFLKKKLSSLPQQQYDIFPTLKLSYDSLPQHLKYCFSYCKLFPKDYEFNVETLINLWIAQGFISVPSDDDSQGYEHFLELLDRCFFQEAKIDEIMNRVVTCKMHDLVHDLAVQVTGKEYIFLLDPSQEEFINRKVRHVSTGPGIIPRLLLEATRLRSLQCLNEASNQFSKPNIEEVLSNFKFLRMLDMQNLDIETVPNSIGKLRHLRYLDLSENNIRSLPTSITKLVNLHTLKLNLCHYLSELPRDITNLVSLKNLEFRSESVHHLLSLPRGVSRLTNLQTLSYFKLSDDPTNSNLDELMDLNNLRGKLDISGLRATIKTAGANLKEKEHLQSLLLKWLSLDDDDTPMSSYEQRYETLEGLNSHPNLRKLVVQGYSGVKFSSWLTSLTNLVELRLKKCLKLNQLSSLEPLCSLTKLCISDCSELEYIITDVVGGGYSVVLPSLQQLKLKNLPDLRGWLSLNTTENTHQGFSTSYFPRLTDLWIWDCQLLTSFPLYPNVKKLRLDNSNKNSFEETVLMSVAQPHREEASTSTEALSKSLSSTFYPLSELSVLSLYCFEGTGVRCFPDWIQNLTSLKTLNMIGYPMSCVSRFYENRMVWKMSGDDEHEEMPLEGNQVTSKIFQGLQKLSLTQVPTLKYLYGPIQYTTALEELRIESCEDLVTLPEWLQHNTSLRFLEVSNCQNLRTIPNWICNFSSLQEIVICDCPYIQSMPQFIRTLLSLQEVQIVGCSNLSRRY